MKKLTYPERICLLMMALFLSPYFIQPLLAQSDDCEKIRVGIYFTYLADGKINRDTCLLCPLYINSNLLFTKKRC